MADPNTRQGKRTPVTLKIKFKSETLEQFIERYAVDVSQGGIFIRTKEPLAVGTQMKFEFQLRDASPLIAGEGTVVWTRENDPSRPAIAPGMGVRFDKLADGSQSVLEKILSEKAKQAPSRSSSDSGPGANKNASFGDETTKVAPAQVQEQLGLRSRNQQDSAQTPLPKPFQSDADDFDEKAFDEATKVRSLDDLALASASDDGSGLDDNPRNMTVIMPADELAARRRVTAEGFDAPASAAGAAAAPAPSRESAPSLPEPPNEPGARKPPTEDDDFPSPSTDDIGSSDEPAAASAADSASTSASDESAATETPAATPAERPSAAKLDNAATPRAVASEPSRPTAPSRPSSAPLVIGILVAVAAAIGGVWWFVLRDPGTSKVADSTAPQTPTTDPVTAPDKEPIADPGGSGSAVVDPDGHVGSAAGAGSGSAGSAEGAAMQHGSAAGSAMPLPVEATVDTVISANAPKGAVVEIVGTDQKGPAPFTAKLEKDRAFKARITAPGFKDTEVDVKGGVKTAAKLSLKPRVLTVVTDPPGADIYVDNFNTQKVTPSEVMLTPGQSAKPRVRVSVRRPGYRAVDQMVDASAFKEAGEGMTHKVEMKLQVAPKVTPPPAGGAGSGSAGAGAGAGGDASGGGSTPPSGGTPPPPSGDGDGSATP